MSIDTIGSLTLQCIGSILLAAVVVLTFFTDIFRTSEAGLIPQLVWLLAALVLLIAVIVMLSGVLKILEALRNSDVRLEKVAETLEKNRAVLTQINQNTRLSGEL